MKRPHAFLIDPPIPGEPILGKRWFEFAVILAFAFLTKLFLF